MTPIRDKIESVIEFIISIIFIIAGADVLFQEPISLTGYLNIFVTQAAFTSYGVITIVIGLLLLFAKQQQRKRLHKHSLLCMYLWSVFLLALTMMVSGVTLAALGPAFVGLVTGFLWLRWKFKTEYFDLREFRSTEIRNL